MNAIKLFLLCLFWLHRPAYGQYMEVEWKNNFLKSQHQGNILGSATDKDGNTYVLGVFDQTGSILGEELNYSDANIFLIKFDPKGQARRTFRIYGMPQGSLAIDNDGNLIIGGSYKLAFRFNGIEFPRPYYLKSPAENHAYIIKITPEGNIIWFKTYPSAYADVNNLKVDNQNNIYASVRFRSQLMVEDKTVTDSTGNFSNCILKLSTDGHVLWHFPIIKDDIYNTTEASPMTLFTPGEGCPQQLLYVARALTYACIGTDTFKFNNEWYATHMVLQVTPDGKLARHLTSKNKITTIDAIETVNNDIYISGIFQDFLTIDGLQLYHYGFNVYIAKLNELLVTEDIQLVAGNSGFYTDGYLKYVAGKGLVAIYSFTDSFSVNDTFYSNRPVIPGTSSVASCIISLDKNLKVTGASILDGRHVFVRGVTQYNSELILAVDHQNTNSFTDSIPYGCTILKPRQFLSDTWPAGKTVHDINYTVYPTPFMQTCHVRFNTPVYGYTARLYDAQGKSVKRFHMDYYNSTTITLDLGDVAAGMYLLRLEDCCGDVITAKLVKQ